MRDRVLVTGAGGFIGRTVTARLAGHGPTTACSRGPVDVNGVDWLPLDVLLDDDRVHEFDGVVHLAGNSNHGLASQAPWADLDATAGLAARLLLRTRARRLVVLSSAAVYAGHVGAVDPTRPVLPAMPYALSKLYVEGLAASLVDRGFFESLLVVRLYNAFGPGERPTRLIPRVVEAASTGAQFRLTGDPQSLSDPVHVDDVARVLIAAVTATMDGTTDLCGGDPTPLDRQVLRIAEALGLRAPEIRVDPDPDQVPIRFWSDPLPLTSGLGIRPVGSFVSSVIEYGQVMGWV